jgi:hypothetical protein
MSTPHAHRYGVPDITALTLPDCDGSTDVFLSWRCLGCRQPRYFSFGTLPAGMRGLHMDAWAAHLAANPHAKRRDLAPRRERKGP